MRIRTIVIAATLPLLVMGQTHAAENEGEVEFGSAVVIIELTDNDIELQASHRGTWPA